MYRHSNFLSLCTRQLRYTDTLHLHMETTGCTCCHSFHSYAHKEHGSSNSKLEWSIWFGSILHFPALLHTFKIPFTFLAWTYNKLLQISLLIYNTTALSHNMGVAEVYFILQVIFFLCRKRETDLKKKKWKQFHQQRSDHFLRLIISGLEKDFLAVAFSAHIFIKAKKS